MTEEDMIAETEAMQKEADERRKAARDAWAAQPPEVHAFVYGRAKRMALEGRRVVAIKWLMDAVEGGLGLSEACKVVP